MKKNNEAILRTGAMALAAAGVSTSANAATVQITFKNSFITSPYASGGGNHLMTDFGGDGVDDLFGLFSNIYQNIAVLGVGSPGPPVARVITPGGASAFAYMRGLGNAVLDRFGSIGGLVQVSFRDGGIRGGAATSGYLDSIVAFNDPYGRVTLKRLIFDDATGGAISGLAVADPAYPEYVAAVPEPSGLGLLALGAGGLLARRRRAMAA